jgi:hypothetical protein
MNNPLRYQIRIHFTDACAETARSAPDKLAKPLVETLSKHGATLKCQFDAFAEYVREAEKEGAEKFPLYKWTKVTIEDPAKKAKHLKSFAVHIAGETLYAKERADALEAALQRFIGDGCVDRVTKHDNNPANNPQPPAHLRA